MEIFAWLIFAAFIVILLIIDLKVVNKEQHEVSTKEALLWTLIWIGLAFVFNIVVYFAFEYNWFNILANSSDIKSGKDAVLKFFTGYLIEKSLSLDNIFVIAMLFAYFNIPLKYQHSILFWGILGALVFRAIMILLGTALIHQFSWIMYVFGGLLVISALKMLFGGESEFDADKSNVVKLIRKFYPVTNDMHGGKFFARVNGIKMATPLFVILMVIEFTDIIFAVDSIPAIFAVTTDAFIVFTSNVFAILGLRSLYFVLASFIEKFKYLKFSLVVLLLFIGIKMLLAHYVHISIPLSLGIIILILAIGIIASLLLTKDKSKN
jgi:tellurite resistance protein TerC